MEFNRYHIAGMEKDKRFFHMPVKERKTLLSHLWIFTYGLRNPDQRYRPGKKK